MSDKRLKRPSKKRSKQIVESVLDELKEAKLKDVLKTSIIKDKSIRVKDVVEVLCDGVLKGSISETRTGKYTLNPTSKTSELEPKDDEEEQAPCAAPCPKKRKKRCRTPAPCPTPLCITFTRRCPALERLVASESFSDVCLLGNPAYLECYTEEIIAEKKCECN